MLGAELGTRHVLGAGLGTRHCVRLDWVLGTVLGAGLSMRHCARCWAGSQACVRFWAYKE